MVVGVEGGQQSWMAVEVRDKEVGLNGFGKVGSRS